MTEGHRSIAVAGVVACALGGCTLITDSFLTNEFSGDPYPINVETSSGAIVVGMRQASGPGDRVAVLDLLSPFTVVDPGPGVAPSVAYADLTLLGKPGPTDPLGGALDLSTALPRARFTEAQVISLHPCDPNPCDPDSETCKVGPTGTRPFTGIIGADVLAGDAVRLRLGDNQIFILPDIGGKDRGRTYSCDAVFDSPYRGGGTLVFPSTELPFGNRRITLQACLGQDADPGPGPFPDDKLVTFRQHGADALFVVSTSIGISILGKAAYERYRLAVAAENPAPPFDALQPGSVYLPSGEVVGGRRAMLDRLALVAASTSNALSPCRQVYAHRLLSAHGPLDPKQCAGDGTTESGKFDCPCSDHSEFCAVPAILELTPSTNVPTSPTGIDVLVVDDTDPTLQALRTELRPDQAEVDGILGTTILRGAEIDVDYPHDRLIARCPGRNCSARPQLAQKEDRCQINSCIKGLQDFRDIDLNGVSLPGCP